VQPYSKAGREKRLFELSTRLAKSGHEVHIYTMHWWKSSEKTRTENGVTLHAISKFYPQYKGDKRSIKQGILFGLACFKLFGVKFDILDVDHMPFFPILSAKVVCFFRRKKLRGTWHEALTTQDWKNYMGNAGLVASAIERLSIKLPYAITAASNHTAQILADYHKRTKNVSVVSSGIDTNLINSVKPTDEKCDVLYVGRFVKDKNVDKLIEAFAIVSKQNPKAQCVIIGHGIEEQNLRQLVKKLNLEKQITILPPQKNAEEIYSYMKRAKVFVLPSVREGFGIVALESLACGTPVVTVNSPANAAKDLITEGKTGSIVPLKTKQIAAATEFWLNQKTKLTQDTPTYDWNNLTNKQVEVYAL
jgi:glycosyltransferase involved in cell wall biosynthesis